MTELERFIIDGDYLTGDYLNGPEQLDILRSAVALEELCEGRRFFWDADDIHLSYIDMTLDEFRRFQSRLLDHGHPVDVLHRVSDTLQRPIVGTRARGRVFRRMGFTISGSPRQHARVLFTDMRTLSAAQAQRGLDRLTASEEDLFDQVMDFREDVRALPVGQQLRFIRVGLELAHDDQERADIAAGPLEDAVVSISSNAQLDEVAHECSISPGLRETCRDYVWTERANWGTGLAARWNEIISGVTPN